MLTLTGTKEETAEANVNDLLQKQQLFRLRFASVRSKIYGK